MEVQNPQCGKAVEAIELFVRSASTLPRRPAVLIMDGSPDQDYCQGHKIDKLEMQYRWYIGSCDGEPPERALTAVYRDYGLHQMSPATLVAKYACNGSDFARKRLYNEGKHYPHPMSWHPGPQGHQLIADMLFMHYGEVFLRALERLEAKVPGITAEKLREQTDSERLELRTHLGLENMGALYGSTYMGAGRGDELPHPRWCAGWPLCDSSGNFRCANTYYPLAGRQGSRLLDMLADGTAVVNVGKKGLVTAPSNGSWALSLNEEKKNILNYLKQPDPEGGEHLPIDRKWVLVGEKKSGPIVFEFETRGFDLSSVRGDGHARAGNGIVNSGRVVVCKPDFINRVKLDDVSGVRFEVDGVETKVAGHDEHIGIHKGSCVFLEAQIGVGHHNLSVEPLKDGAPYVAVSHVVYPA